MAVMRSEAQLREEQGNLTEKFVENPDIWNEAALAAIDWALGLSDARPSED